MQSMHTCTDQFIVSFYHERLCAFWLELQLNVVLGKEGSHLMTGECTFLITYQSLHWSKHSDPAEVEAVEQLLLVLQSADVSTAESSCFVDDMNDVPCLAIFLILDEIKLADFIEAISKSY